MRATAPFRPAGSGERAQKKQKMFADLEGSILSAAILALCVAIGIAFVCKVDLQAVKMCKRAGMLVPGISDS